jgi:aarF domain-containing kinase
MAFGAVGETLRRATGSKDEGNGSIMFSASNMERLVAKLSKMRGAALKLGQMMSLQGGFVYITSSQLYLTRRRLENAP